MASKQREFTTEVIIAVYNNIAYTRACLNGFSRQSVKDFYVAIADDGSDEKIKLLVNEFSNTLNIRHLWHEDRGFRKALILNKAITTSTADYIIFVDNDCVPHKDFIKDHIHAASPHQSVTGRRVNLGSEISRRLTQDFDRINSLENTLSLLLLIMTKKVRDGEKGFHLPMPIASLLNHKKRGFLGSNMAIWLHDLNKINGFDSSFTGYGFEETDLQWRLEKIGIQTQSLVNRAIQYHLYHKQKPVTNINKHRIEGKKRDNTIISPQGLTEAKANLNHEERKQ